jgi:hypothetical protein
LAVTPRDKLESGAEGDPTEESEAATRQYSVRVPDSLPLSRSQGEVVYDRPSDTMLVLFCGRIRDSFVVYTSGDYAALLDSDTEDVTGIQIEDYLFSAVTDEPWLIELLEYAELLGMLVAEVRDARQRALGYRGRVKSWLGRMVRTVTGRGEPHPRQAVEELLNRKQFGTIVMNPTGPV